MDLNIKVRYRKGEEPELFDLIKHIRNRKVAGKVRLNEFAVGNPEKLIGGKK